MDRRMKIFNFSGLGLSYVSTLFLALASTCCLHAQLTVPGATYWLEADTLGDTAGLRVRVDVDESDIGKVQVGQSAYVSAQAYGDRKFWGRVVRISQMLGKKNIRTEEPTERIDTKILETLIELQEDHKLPSGLRVNAFIVVNE